MTDTFFKKTSEKMCDGRISTLCLDRFSKQGCRHWIQYENGKINQLRREEIIHLFNSKNLPLPCHYRDEDVKDIIKNEKKNCVIS